VTDPRHDLARTYHSLGDVERKSGRPEAALGHYNQSHTILKQLCEARPEATEYQAYLARTCNALGVLRRAQQPAEVLHDHEQARAAFRALVQAYPDNLDYRTDLAATCEHIGATLVQLGRREEVVPALQEAVTQQRIAFVKAPQVVHWRQALNRQYIGLAQVQRDLGRPAPPLPCWSASNSGLPILANSIWRPANSPAASRW
jgi:tetratricopeptide (TPR) repeat protein